MRHRRWLLALLIVPTLLAGCMALETERGRLRTAADTYAAVTGSLADAWEAGKLTRAQKRVVLKWSDHAHRALREWRRRLESRGGADGPRDEFMRAIRVLNKVWMDVQDGPGTPPTRTTDPKSGG